MTFNERVTAFKYFIVRETLKETGGNRYAAADRLGCHRNTILRWSRNPSANRKHRSAQEIAHDQLNAGLRA